MEKTYEQIDNEKKEKKYQLDDLKSRIGNMKDWIKYYKDLIKQANIEIGIKAKAPLPVEPKYEYERLPEWAEHLAKSYELGIKAEIMKYEAEIYQLKHQIHQTEKALNSLEKEGELNE